MPELANICRGDDQNPQIAIGKLSVHGKIIPRGYSVVLPSAFALFQRAFAFADSLALAV
jgi:hypothetical protein